MYETPPDARSLAEWTCCLYRDMASKATDRDIFNEKPSREEQTIAAVQPTKQAQLANSATIHTTKGDIHFRLYPDKTPKTVENFVLLAKRGYYDGVIFHRVIKKFVRLWVPFSILSALG